MTETWYGGHHSESLRQMEQAERERADDLNQCRIHGWRDPWLPPIPDEGGPVTQGDFDAWEQPTGIEWDKI